MKKYELTIESVKNKINRCFVGYYIGDPYGYDKMFFKDLKEIKSLIYSIDNYISNMFGCSNNKFLSIGDDYIETLKSRVTIELLSDLNEILKILDDTLKMSFKKLDTEVCIDMLIDSGYRYNKYTKRDKNIDINKTTIGDILEIEFNKDIFDKRYTITINSDYLNDCKENDKAIIDLIYYYDTEDFKIEDNIISFKIERELLKY